MPVPAELRRSIEARYTGKARKDALFFLELHGYSAVPPPPEVARMVQQVEENMSRVLEGFLGRGIASRILELGKAGGSAPVTLFEFLDYWKGLLGRIEYVSGLAGLNWMNSRLEERLKAAVPAFPAGSTSRD